MESVNALLTDLRMQGHIRCAAGLLRTIGLVEHFPLFASMLRS